MAGDTALRLTWDDGSMARVDLSVIIAACPALAPVGHPAEFPAAALSADGWSVGWPGGIDFGTAQLRRWAVERAGEAMP